MGRSLSLYAVSNVMVHDKSKRICLDWEYEREPDEMKYELKKKGLDFPEEDDIYPYTDGSWCPSCAIFAPQGLHRQNTLVRAYESWSHSYGNTIWSSDWHFYNMHPGSSHSDLVNKFKSDNMYSQIDVSDIEYMERKKLGFGEARCTSDRTAVDETQQFITFSNKWLQEPDTTVIYKSET
jgi:hypothetical protein